MKRYVCTVVAGMLLALAGAGVATAGLPVVGGQEATQSTIFGDQTVGKQSNDADVTQAQGNGNVNISPAISIFGDASSSNDQGNGNTAVAVVDQGNSASQSQTADQEQSLAQDGSGSSCCSSSNQSGEQRVYGGDQSIGEQRNDADVTQKQGNGNVNVSPAVSVFGDASTYNSQGNDNTAIAKVDQSNDATQTQSSSQSQTLDQNHGSCCGGQSQTGEQKTRFGGQSIGKQRNDADVRQEQGNGNVNISPAISVWGDASTWNAQGNGNKAVAKVDQSNEATQSQSASQQQDLSQQGGCCSSGDGYAKDDWYGEKKDRCCTGPSQTAEQKVRFGDQTVGKQSNDADVTQTQGNGNVNVSPAVPLFGKRASCSKECDASWGNGGAASTWNAQGNGNFAFAGVHQSNDASQSQAASQTQSLIQGCCDTVMRS
jgi:epidermal growth factor receptor substrate 15